MQDFAKAKILNQKGSYVIRTSCRSEARLMSGDRTNFRCLGGRHLGVARIQILAKFSLKRTEDERRRNKRCFSFNEVAPGELLATIYCIVRLLKQEVWDRREREIGKNSSEGGQVWIRREKGSEAALKEDVRKIEVARRRREA